MPLRQLPFLVIFSFRGFALLPKLPHHALWLGDWEVDSVDAFLGAYMFKVVGGEIWCLEGLVGVNIFEMKSYYMVLRREEVSLEKYLACRISFVLWQMLWKFVVVSSCIWMEKLYVIYFLNCSISFSLFGSLDIGILIFWC